MDKQMINPPETWNDNKAIRESFRLWFGWYGWKEARASFGAFRRGYMSGAIAASIEMWNWIQGAVFGQETEKKAAGPEEELPMMTEREQKVLRLRFGLDDGRARTLEEVGKEFNVTRERIRQIEAKALRKLRHPSRSRKLKDYLD